MRKAKQIEIKNRTYYFDYNMINIKNFDSNLLKIDKKLHRGNDIYYVRYITIKKIDNRENNHSLNSFVFAC